MTPLPHQLARLVHPRARLAGLVMLAAGLACGCDSYQSTRQNKIETLEAEVLARQDKIDRLESQLQWYTARNDTLKSRVANLMKLGDRRLEFIPAVEKIELLSQTGGMDTDGKPGHDIIKIFLKPLDADGSVLKSGGTVTIRLFDLSREKGQERIHEMVIGPEELNTHWSSGLLSRQYSFDCPLPADLTNPELTVRVELVDYLSGGVHSASKNLTVALPPSETPTPAETQPAETQPAE